MIKERVKPIKELETLLKETVAQEAKRLLQDVPEDRWCTRRLLNFEGKSCALGHYYQLKTGELPDADVIIEVVTTAGAHKTSLAGLKLRIDSMSYFCIVNVNDSCYKRYSQPTPKQRVMAFLDDCIKAGL